MNVVDKIQHYQRSIERCNNNETKTLHCIDRLYKLPVTVQHLQETGVGRTVNALRKFDGSVGDAAKALVAKWKTMVVDEESSGEEEDEACVPDASEGYSDRSNSPKFDRDNGDEASSTKNENNDSAERTGSSEKHNSTKYSSSSSSESYKSREIESTKNGTDKSHAKHEADTRIEKKSKSSRDSKRERYDSSKETSANHESSSSGKSRSKSDDARKDSSRVSSSGGVVGSNSGSGKNSSHDSQRKRKIENSLVERESSSKRRRSVESPIAGVEYDDPDDIPTQIMPRDSEDEPCKSHPDTSIDSESEEDSPKIKIKREAPDSPPTYDRGGSSLGNSVKVEKSSRHKSRESSSKTSGPDKSRRESDKHDKAKSEKPAVDHRKNEKRKDEDRPSLSKESSSKSRRHSGSSSSSKDQKASTHKDGESSSSKRESKSDSDTRDTKEKFKEPREKKDKKVKKKKKLNEDGGIDCNSGASFAEALGMCTDRPVARKKTAPASPSSPLIKSIKSEPSTSVSSSSLLAPSSSSKSAVKVKAEPLAYSDPQPLSLLAPNVKLQPLNVDLASTLPEISPNYKPLPCQYTNSVHRKQEEAKALSDVIFTKSQRTKVYSGNKTSYTSVPSLYDMCLRVLMENIDGLGFTGGIPYDILKPVLERATADQLFTLENYNPYLIEDTDPLWEFHCNKEFRKFKREELDSWRDTYMRCRDEREVKLRNITASIKESIDKSVPVRSAKLAYVDNVVKPPRNVLRKQAKYGTAHSSSSDIKKKLILSGGSNTATNIAVPPPPSARMKTSSSSVGKKSKAPLMAKALQLIKGRYKR